MKGKDVLKRMLENLLIGTEVRFAKVSAVMVAQVESLEVTEFKLILNRELSIPLFSAITVNGDRVVLNKEISWSLEALLLGKTLVRGKIKERISQVDLEFNYHVGATIRFVTKQQTYVSYGLNEEICIE